MKKIKKLYIFYKYKNKDIGNHTNRNCFYKMWDFGYKVCRKRKNDEIINDIWWYRFKKINTKKIKCVECIQDNEDIYI